MVHLHPIEIRVYILRHRVVIIQEHTLQVEQQMQQGHQHLLAVLLLTVHQLEVHLLHLLLYLVHREVVVAVADLQVVVAVAEVQVEDVDNIFL